MNNEKKMPDDTKNQQIGLYIKKDLLSRMPKKEAVILFQILRIINSLRFWMRLLMIIKEKDKVFVERNRIELCFEMICFYKESTKEFCNNLANGLSNMDISEPLKQKISKYKEWLENWKHDDYLQIVDKIRNCLRFHLDSCIYNKITEGNQQEDLLIAYYNTGDQYNDWLFTEPYSLELEYIAKLVPVNIKGIDEIDWILKKSKEEIEKFIDLLGETFHEICKDNIYKKKL